MMNALFSHLFWNRIAIITILTPVLLCSVETASASPASDAVLAARPTAYWRLNELMNPAVGSSIVYDNVGGFDGLYGTNVQNGFNGITGPQLVDGFPGFSTDNVAAAFSTGAVGSPDVTCPALNLNTNTVTITAWIKPATLQARFSGIVFCRETANASGLRYNNVTTTNGSLGYSWNNDPNTYGWESGLIPPTNQWSFVALSVTPSNAVIYLINASGVQSATRVLSHAVYAFPTNTLIGNDAYAAGRVFNGRIDEVAVFNRSLSLNDLTDLYAAAASAPATPPYLTNTWNGLQLTLSWATGYTLLQATNLQGPWNTNSTVSPLTVVPSTNSGQHFFRLKLPEWTERILNQDGSINWPQYDYVATHAWDADTRDYLLGPKYSVYHPIPETFPTLDLQGDADGWDGCVEKKAPLCLDFKDLDEWYCQTGPLVYVADNTNNAGVIRAANGEYFHYSQFNPPYGYWCRLHWGVGAAEGWYTATTPVELSSYGNPKKPIAVASATGIEAFQQYVAFQNGVVGTFPTIPSGYSSQTSGAGVPFPYVQFPAGKVPMSIAVTPGGEFVLAGIWDTVNHKGQLGVIAVQGRVRCSETNYTGWSLSGPYKSGTYMYGLPGWMTTKAMKILGYVDLPIAAPTAIKAGTDMGWTYEGRNNLNVNSNLDFALNNQSERDKWYTNNPAQYPNFKAIAHSGYALIASRTENKVVFVDLQPMLQYYRTMYFTTQSNLDATRILGAATNQWPYTFDYVPAQKPVVAFTLDVPAPTAVAAGLGVGMCTGAMGQCDSDGTLSSNGIGEIRPSVFGGDYAYVTTMDGQLRIYYIGGLNTEFAATEPILASTVNIGKNPSSMENGNGGINKNDLYINCRGDRAVYVVLPDGTVRYVLRDSRMGDPVMTEPSVIGRLYTGVPVRSFIHVVDFTGKKVLTYSSVVVTNSSGADFTTPVKFGAPVSVPGYPFAYQQDEVQ